MLSINVDKKKVGSRHGDEMAKLMPPCPYSILCLPSHSSAFTLIPKHSHIHFGDAFGTVHDSDPGPDGLTGVCLC